jgi:hypothetical protein
MSLRWGERCRVLVRVCGRERKVVRLRGEVREVVKAQKSTTCVPWGFVMRRVEFLGRARARPLRGRMGWGGILEDRGGWWIGKWVLEGESWWSDVWEGGDVWYLGMEKSTLNAGRYLLCLEIHVLV